MRYLIALALVGCTAAAPPPDIRPVTPVQGELPPIEQEAFVAAFPLSALPGLATGVTVEPDTGRRLVLMNQGALYDLDSGEAVWEGGAPDPRFGFTDVTALGEGWVALTSRSDGFVMHLDAGTPSPHFCYEPGWWDPEEMEDPVQISAAVTHDAASGRLYAQPRTVEQGGFGATTESFIAAYDEAGGEDLTWWTLDPSYVAGGMAVLEAGSEESHATLLLGSGDALQRFDAETGELGARVSLRAHFVESVGGLAIDRERGTVLVLDDARGLVIELRLSTLQLR
ncbi:MAG: hypothetical protein EVA89_25590 [Sandaracinaceae bacterium]|nr:MAG: hypothetical protein EVA89_25590 [Sandaracinaceae bacterium]